MEIVSQLEANPMCQSLSLHSFLMLPMQRITRMPLLLDAVLSKMDPLTDSDEYKTYQITLATLNKVSTVISSFIECKKQTIMYLNFRFFFLNVKTDCKRVQ